MSPTYIYFTTSGDCQLNTTYSKQENVAWFTAWGGNAFADCVGWPIGGNYAYNETREFSVRATWLKLPREL